MNLSDKLRAWRDYPITLFQREVYSSLVEDDADKALYYMQRSVSGMMKEGMAYGCILGCCCLLQGNDFGIAFMFGALAVPATMAARGAQLRRYVRHCSSLEELYGPEYRPEREL